MTVSAVPDRVIIYQAKDGWRWHRRDGYNAKIVSESGEGYTRKDHAVRMAELVNGGTFVVEISDHTTDDEPDEPGT